MKIVNIVPGFGGSFYCGNCLRDSVFTKTLRKMGHDSVLLPIYLPISSGNENGSTDIPVFYGAVSIYLKQNYRLFRNMPPWLHRFFDSKPILRYAAQKAGSTRATGLEDMTISMLKGSDGLQWKELDELINFLKHHEKPDVVHLSNALLLGLASRIKNELNIPVVCSLQDEDVWVDAMEEQHRQYIWQLMSEKGNDVDAFVVVSNFFADLMKTKMQLPDHKLFVVPIGVDPGKYKVSQPSCNPPVIGYLSRLCEENGLEILIDAFIELKTNAEFSNAKLKLTGGMTGDDKRFIKKQTQKLNAKGYLKDVEIVPDFGDLSLKEFLGNITVLSVPVLKGEAFGLYQLEAMASGVPVVQPALGAFPEIAEQSGGGVIYQPNTPNELAKTFAQLFANTAKIQELSIAGRASIVNKFNTEVLTTRMIEVYEGLTKKN